MVKYGPAAQKEVKKAVSEYKKGKLKKRGGAKVENRQQAIAIGLSKARSKGAKVPRRKKKS